MLTIISVVSSDPKSRTGEEDKEEITKLYSTISLSTSSGSMSVCRILANGGKTIQVIPKLLQQPVLIVYGGNVTRRRSLLMLTIGHY